MNGFKEAFSINKGKLVSSLFEQIVSNHSEGKFLVIGRVPCSLLLEVSLVAAHSSRDQQQAMNVKLKMVVRVSVNIWLELWKLTTIV